MTLSVLMSTYIKEKPHYLDEALDSIWSNQTRKPDQIVLVEDGLLTKELYAIIKKWKEFIGDKLTIISNKQNKGLALALNDGIEVCTGDFIARMDSDDIAMPNRFELEERFLLEHPNTDIIGGALQEFNDYNSLDKIRQYPQTVQEIRNSIHKASPLGHPTVMFRKSFFDAGHRYNNKYYICEDVTLWFEALASGAVINNIPDIVLKFRRNDSMMKRRGKQKAWSEFLAYTHGIYMLDGIFTLKYIYPLARLIFRLMPTYFIKHIYNSNFRNKITK